MAVKSNSIDMIHGPLWGKILKFSALFMLTALLQQLYNAADVIVVGRYAGQEALAGVGTSSTIVNLFMNFIVGLSAGAVIVLGQAIGAGQEEGISKAAHTAIATAVYGGLLMAIACLIFTKPLLKMIDVPDNVVPEALAYLRVRAVGFVPALIYNFGAGILRAKGDTKRALYIVTVSGIINVLLNLFFVCVCHMGAAGVAWATVASQIFTAIVMMIILRREEDNTRIHLKKIRFYKEPFWKMVRFGLPSGIQSAVYSMSNLLVQSSVNSFGSAAIAGSAASTSITEFYNVMLNSMYQAAMVFTSQNFGAKQFDRIKKTVRICLLYVVGLGVIQSGITYFADELLLGLYLPDDPEGLSFALRKFNLLGYTYAFLGIMNVMSGALRGMGASIMNLITSVVGVCGIRIVWILTAFQAIGTFESLYWCFPLSWAGTFVMHYFMYRYVFGKEKKKAALEIVEETAL